MSGSIFIRKIFFLFIGFLFVLGEPLSCIAEEASFRTYNTPRFTLHVGAQNAPASGEYSEELLVENALLILDDTYKELSRIFAVQPEDKVVLRFLSPAEFERQTGAPSWTSAMFYRGEISIPVDSEIGINFTDLRRAIRHEYIHAVMAEISDYRCPAWLDEGIAQVFEGKPNPLLGPALRKWILHNKAMPLDWLHNGFTGLDSSIVPAAYAQSLFATRQLVNAQGFRSVVHYLRLLKKNYREKVAFEKAFKVSKKEFEKKLTERIVLWSRSGQLHP